MKQIPESFRKDQYDHELVDRVKDLAVYRKSKDAFHQFELMKIRKHKKDRVIAGNTVSVAGDEYLPSTTEWGGYGWTLPDMVAVEAKIAELEKRNDT